MSIRKSALALSVFMSGIFTTSLAEAACPSVAPTDYLVFSRGEIRYEYSDFQGLTGAGGDFSFIRFELGPQPKPTSCQRLVVGGEVDLNSGHVSGAIEAGRRVSLSHVSVVGTVTAGGGVRIHQSSTRGRKTATTAAVRALPSTGDYFVRQSGLLGQLQATTRGTSATPGVLDIQATQPGYNVVWMSADEWSQYNVIRLSSTNPSALLVINLTGLRAGINAQDIRLIGMNFGQVVMNYVEAQELVITASGAREYGIPATILAPYAATAFWNGLISGGLYVGSLCGSGQVNPGKFVGWVREGGKTVQPPGLLCPPGAIVCK